MAAKGGKVRAAAPSGERAWWPILLALALPVSLAVGALGYRSLMVYRSAESRVRHTYEVLAELDRVMMSMASAEASQRGFLLTQDKSFIQRYEEWLKRGQEAGERVRALTRDNPRQQELLSRMEPVFRARVAALRDVVARWNAGDQAGFRQAIRENRSLALSAQLQRMLAELRTEEERLLQERSAVTDAEARSATFGAAVGSAGLFGLLAFGMVLLRRDRQGRQQAEDRFRESETRYRQLVEGVTDHAIFALDANGRIATWNSGAERITGYTEGEAVGQHLRILYRREDQERKESEEHLATARERGQHHGEGWRVRKDGSFFWAEASVNALRGDDGAVVGFSKITRDLTERMVREEEQRESSATIRALLESAAQAILTVNRSGCITLANATAERLFGYTREQLTGMPVNDLLPSRVRGGHSEHQATFFADPRPRPMGMGRDLAARRSDGTEFPVEISLSAIETRAGLQTVAFVSDITARKQAENELRALTATLEARVEERTSALEEANQELTAFAYSVSHDLRAPLRAVDGYGLALLEDYPDGSLLDAEAVRLISRMRAGTKRMAQLIEDLLNLSRVSRAPMERSRVDVSGLAGQVADDLSATEPGREVEWRILPAMYAYGDGKLLRILLENLMGNAWKFTSRTARPAIEVSAAKDGGAWTYFVRDNGAGFNPDYREKLFTPFQRLHRESEFPGTGIGLATASRIVHRHGGRIWAEGEPDKGATIFFTLGESDGSEH